MSGPAVSLPSLALSAATLLAAGLAGCIQPAYSPPEDAAAAAPPVEEIPAQESWDVYYIQGTRVGYGSTKLAYERRDGGLVLVVAGENRMRVRRFGQEAEQAVTFRSVETTAGQLLEFSSEMQQGPVPLSVLGRVEGDQFLMTTVTAGKSLPSAIPWDAKYGGPYAPELSMLRQPLQPGEHRQIKHLVPGFNQVATTDLLAKDYEQVEMLDGPRELLRIETAIRFADGQILQGVTWTDRAGQVRKTSTAALGIVSYRTTKDVALAQQEQGGFDLGADLSVPLDHPLRAPHEATELRYRVHLEGGDPASVFVAGPTQRLKPIDAHTAELTVYAIRPGQPGGNPDAPAESPTAADREPNSLVQSDDPAVVALAEQGAGSETDPWKAALALEQFVHRTIRLKNFSQAFATAAEVAQSREGDCTEHAVLLAALCRARGIPARAAIGLVYVEREMAFAYHMWNEVYVDGRWVPIDATLARGGIGAGHLKLAQSNLEGAGAYSSFLPVIQVTGRLKIEAL